MKIYKNKERCHRSNNNIIVSQINKQTGKQTEKQTSKKASNRD